jgi:hypothetical protein
VRAAVLFLILLASAAAVPARAEDFRIVLTPGQQPRFEGAGVEAELLEETPGESLAWRLTTASPALAGSVASDGYFAVERARQVVPEVRDTEERERWRFLTEVDEPDPAGGYAVNLTLEGTQARVALAFPVNGSTELRLTRDVASPGFTVGPVQNLTHQSFYLETTTTEYARANLVVRPAGGGEEIPSPTVLYSLLQRFPVQGLRPDTAYVLRVEFEDWARNAARSPDQDLRTLPAPVLPAPVVTAREPAPDSILPGPVDRIAVNFTGPAPASVADVRVFVDKVPTSEGLALQPGRLEVRLRAPLGPGPHSVGVELTSEQGGTAVERWSFQVAGAAPGAPATLALLGAAGALASERRRSARRPADGRGAGARAAGPGAAAREVPQEGDRAGGEGPARGITCQR